MKRLALVIFILLGCAGRQTVVSPLQPGLGAMDVVRPLPWAGKHPDAAKWSTHTLELVGLSKLPDSEPEDMKAFCPKYQLMNRETRIEVWANLFAIMAKFESGYKPETKYQEEFSDAKGKPVISRGLLQLSIESGRAYGCEIPTAEALHDPRVNLACGLRIMERWVVKDKRVAGSVLGKWRGGARYWSVLRDTAGKKSYAAIKAHVQGVCRE